MKYLLNWMNNCEKELLSSCEPLYNYAQWVRNSASEMASLIQKGFDDGEIEIPELMITPKDSVVDYITTLVVTSLDEYCRTYLPPSILTLESPKNGGPDLLKSSTSIRDTIEVLHTLIANVVAFPHTFNEVIQETSTTIKHSTGHVERDTHTEIMEYIEPYLTKVLQQTMNEAPAAITNTKWGLKALMTYFFLKHSHKIQLTEVVQKMFEMTDISDKVDISKNLKLPYPMNYIEFNKSLPITMSNNRIYEITGALMYEVEVLEDEYDYPDKDVHLANIQNFPKENCTFVATMHGLIGLDQVTRTKNDGYKNMRVQYDKALFPLCIYQGELDAEGKMKPEQVMFGADRNKLHDNAETYLMGIPKVDLPQMNQDSGYFDTTINGLLSINWEQMLTIGYGKLSFQAHDILPEIAKLGVVASNDVMNMVIDPLFKYNKEKVGHNIKPEKYTVVELIINYDKYSDKDTALWSNIGPYIEIGRREGGDLWETVKEAFRDTLSGENAVETNKKQFLEAFKLALQSIWFINEPDVKLKEASEEQPSKRRKYFPKTKVTNRRKIVLRGEISRYLNSLRKTVRSSPKGAWWVRGHWRNQWYPSIQDNKRKWIRPYVKGTGKATKKQVDLDPNTEA